MAAFVSQNDFDFKVRLPTHSLTLKEGQSISIPVVVGTIRGKTRPVKLITSDWKSAGVSAEVAPSPVPSGRVATMHISVAPGTPPDSYLLTVRGSAEGTFNTSNDSIRITVEPESEEKDGEADAGNGSTLPMTGMFSRGPSLPGTLRAA